MTRTNQIQKSDDFQLAIIFKVDCRNGRAILLRFVGIAITLIALGVKAALWFLARAT